MCSLSWCSIYLKDLPGTCGDIPTEHMHLRGKIWLGQDHPAMRGKAPLPDLAPALRPLSGHCLSISAPTRSRPTSSSVSQSRLRQLSWSPLFCKGPLGPLQFEALCWVLA